MSKLNRNYKAGVFTHLFGEPQKELELYNAFSPVQYPPDTPVTDLTLADALYMDRVNDLSFSIGNKLVVFFEAQSSINENMPLRYLLYCGRVYEKLIDNALMYAERRNTIHTPEFYVLYNGVKPFPERAIYRLSDSFSQPTDGEPTLELVVTVYNVNKGFNEDIVKRSENLFGYVTLTAKAREFEQSGMGRPQAVEKAIKECLELGILAEYLKNHASEVSNMLLQEWKIEDARAVWEKEAEARGKESSDQKWQKVVEDIVSDRDAEIASRNAEIASRDAEIAKLKAQLEQMHN
jgi:polyhydroxyalkanoate synthesis regulator phasin